MIKVRLKIRADYMRFLSKSPTNRKINLRQRKNFAIYNLRRI
ncbi:hypothetical protein GCHA_2689 [Paraglaciecola chathamensis S18K6]|uniref:Uncharacterized protein n=1 Tax=Paraglaciecola chathamensis S18K6 TaxID=1127672 RepID=A0AAV3V1B5_9ALTE|nr:hypothetical protein GCHA_2689 [Paraglaciecola chathamensis S18K6]